MQSLPSAPEQTTTTDQHMQFRNRKVGFSLGRSLRRAQNIIKGLGPKTIVLLAFGSVATVFGFQQVLSKAGVTLGTQAASTQTAVYVARQAVNQDGASFVTDDAQVWFGNAESRTDSYLGLYFEGPPIPAQAQIKNIQLYVTSASNQWIQQSTRVHAVATPTVARFSPTNRPSQVALSQQYLEYKNNIRWSARKQYAFPSLLQLAPVIAQHEGSFGLVLKGTGNPWGRKTVFGARNADRAPKVVITYTVSEDAPKTSPSPTPVVGTDPGTEPQPSPTPVLTTPVPTPTATPNPGEGGNTGNAGGDSIAMRAWAWDGKNKPDPRYDKCDDGTDIVQVHNMYYVIAYDGMKYPTWHPPVVNNPITGTGKCYFGHEHGLNPEGYMFWNEIHQHFGKDTTGDGVITPMSISSTGQITPGDRAGLPFGIANEHMAMYYTIPSESGGYFHRHEDHVGHKVEFVNRESDLTEENSTHRMTQIPGTFGLNVPLYKNGNSNVYYPTGVSCAHLHKFHQGTHAPDAILNNLHETIMHSKCVSSDTDANGNVITNADGTEVRAAQKYPNNTVLLTGMMAFGNPGGYLQFCWDSRDQLKCPEGANPDGSCRVTDPLISQLPNSVYSDTLGRNMVDRECLQRLPAPGQNGFYFNPYEIWQGDLRITRADGKMVGEHGRQWDVIDPIRFVDWGAPGNIGYNSMQCGEDGLLHRRTILCEHGGTGVYQNEEWNSPRSRFRGLKRTTYFGRNRISNQGGPSIWWTDPLGSNATTNAFPAGLKQMLSPVEADICAIGGGCTTLNDRAVQRQFPDGGGTVHAPN